MPRYRLFVDGRIWTSHGPEPAEAFLVREGRVVAIGSEAAVRRKADVGVPTTDLHGRTVVPGLIDAHTHLMHQGLLEHRVDLAGTTDRQEALMRIRKAAGRHRGRGLLLAERWDESAWADATWPSQDELDRITTRFPLIARRIDGHVAVPNTPALRHVQRRLPGVDVERGLLLEDASLHLNRVWPTPPRVADRAALLATRKALALGITGVHDFVTPGYEAAYRRLDRTGRLRLRVVATRYDVLGETVPRWPATPHVRRGGVKLFADGSLGAHTAALHAPYKDTGETGDLLYTDARLRARLREAARHGRQPCVHAIGDRAIDQVLAAFARLPAHKRSALRPRIEHAEMLRPDHLDTVRDLGVVLSMQPNFLGPWLRRGGLYERRLGPRARRTNAFRKILGAGVPLAFGSDCMPLDPWLGLRCAVTAPHAHQRLPWPEALAAYTRGAAYAQRTEDDLGGLAVGKRADFAVLKRPYDPVGGKTPGILATYVGGRVAWTPP